ncbi:stomatal closure-related actin-binding protein 2-like [Alnus glutinosa]|uniref:stomatal closure-related actin-binding protein 2-like n=1 Tax=Alnus glutinosa TaxID=3517 RepID=UPI002D767D90|nr:stomatal closure-related actin-binding protein 2-like [Alnus glutinosa]XP_062168055.1 stomatal closure-related actin-binding protein 2-like [Alnus glutinosa]XP_062168056.1 stomatal closure-related actin-binding protein 2-like [Alnus glutinosa]
MTKISPEFEVKMQAEEVLEVSADVSFASNRFPKYKLGADNQILEEPKEDNLGPSLKEVVEQETANLSEQHKRLSVRDLASKFDKNLAAAAKLSDEAKLREVASLEGHVLLKKLRDALESLRGRLAGRNKEDVEKAISMVEALAVKLTQKEGELIQEKFEVKKLANYLKQASEDAKKLVNQEKSFACAEIESARLVVQRIGEALEEEERNSPASKKQDVEDLIEEVQEGRRIKVLHQPSKMMDMEHELRALRTQIREKSIFSVKLQKELAISKRDEENKSSLYILDGSENLGSYLRIRPRSDKPPLLSKCSIHWYRLSSEGSWREVISGANKSIYAPEPFDVGRILQAEIVSNGQKFTVTTTGPIETAAGLGSYVETLLRKSNAEFNVVISQMNGQDHPSHSVHAFHVGKMRIKLCRGWITKARENYSLSMQLCGVRGDGNNAAKALFWQPRKGLSFVLTFESERERNAAIMLARKYALDCNVMLAGPDDQV